MARYTGPATKKSRRLRVDLIGGDQAFERRPYPPGQHGRARIKESEYRFSCRRSRRPASPTASWKSSSAIATTEANRRSGKTGDELLRILETRLDNVVYRAGIARTRRQGPPAGQPRPLHRQRCEGRRAQLPRQPVRHRRRPAEVAGHHPVPDRQGARRRSSGSGWLQVVPSTLRILVHNVPERAQIDIPITEQLIVEFYSK